MLVCYPTESELSAQGRFPAVLRPVDLLRRMGDECGTVLVRASDGLLYCVKMAGNLLGPNVLANEAMGSELAKYLGLPVPAWQPIEFSADFLDENPLSFRKSDSEFVSPQPGLYFASRAVDQDGCGAVQAALPASWFSGNGNPNDFVGMLILDLWANRVGQRKAVFRPFFNLKGVSAVFIDNSLMFGGAWGREVQRPGEALYADHRVYDGKHASRIIAFWLDQIHAINEKTLLGLSRSIPREWKTSSFFEHTAAMLTIREARLAELVCKEMRLIAETGR